MIYIKKLISAVLRGIWLQAQEAEIQRLTANLAVLRLGEKQELFSRMLFLLLIEAHRLGYTVRMGDVLATSGHIKGSFHYKKLAADLNLFLDGEFLQETEDHQKLGEYWESLGGTWGGRYEDGNHYSLGEGTR